MASPRVVVMGVSGCGKSTVGRELAHLLGVAYVEGDELHPPCNVERMAAGIPLTDADRHGWLQAVAGQLSTPAAVSAGVVVSCSALKRSYRDLLRASAPDVRFVHLTGSRELLAARMAARKDHYMPPSLLQSQLDTLEPPGVDERPITLDIGQDPQTLVKSAARELQAPTS
jgi:gluconokinase